MKLFGKISLVNAGTEWSIDSLEPHARIRLKSIFTKFQITKQPPYLFANSSQNAADLAWFISRYPLEISDSDKKNLLKGEKAYQQRNDKVLKLLSDTETPHITGNLKPGFDFRDYQAKAIKLAHFTKSLLIGDDVGLGKTWCGFGLGYEKNTLPLAIVVEPNLQIQWLEKIEEVTEFVVHKIEGTRPYELPRADIYLFRYSQLAGWSDFFAEGIIKAVVYDEIQNLRSGEETQKGKGAKILSDNATYKMGLSATPIFGYGIEIWNIYRFLDPELLGDKKSFIREWCTNEKIVKEPEALGTYLRETHSFLKRNKNDVGQNDKNVNSYIQRIDYDPTAIKDAEQLAVDLAMTTLNGTFTEKGRAAREFDLRLREMTGVSKAKNVAAFVKMVVESGEKVLLAGWHRDVYEIWQTEFKKMGIDYCMYTGSESTTQKVISKERFTTGGAQVMMMSLRSGSGLDGIQQHCSYAIFGELDWSAEVIKQFIGRLDREGQLKIVTAIFMITNFGSDPPMQDLIAVKKDQSRGITDPGKGIEAIQRDTKSITEVARQFLKTKGISV